jgi:uncharacterized membrane protein
VLFLLFWEDVCFGHCLSSFLTLLLLLEMVFSGCFFLCGDSFCVAADLFFGLFLFCCVGVDAVLAVVLVGLFFFFVAGELGKKEFSDMIKQFNGLFDNQYVPASCAPSAASGQS